MKKNKKQDEPIWVVSTTYNFPKTIEQFRSGWLKDDLGKLSDTGLACVLGRVMDMLEKKITKEHKEYKNGKLIWTK
jgi:hypothetical protein